MNTYDQRFLVSAGTGLRWIGRAAVALCMSCAMVGTMAQTTTFKVNPEFEALIDEAERLNVDPLVLAARRKLPEQITISLSEYMDAKIKAEVAEIRAELAKAEAYVAQQKIEAKELDAKSKELDAKLLHNIKLILTSMKTLEAQGRLDAKAITDLNGMASNPVLPDEAKALVRREFGKYLKH
jgi:hypothetical protein